jgi:hypoxia up-regulated 1
MMAVDLGSEYLKVSLIKPGRTPIAIVVNEMSKRKTPALVGFSSENERLMGEEAFSFATRFPETTYARARDMLARPADHPVLTKMLKDHGLPFTLVPHPNRSVAAVQVKEGQVHAVEELVVSS